MVAKYVPRLDGREPTRGFVVLYGHHPIGYVQMYRIHDYPEYAEAVGEDEDAAGVDLFIGEAEYQHRGLGASLLHRSLAELVFPLTSCVSCIIGPEVENHAAIRAYQKAGFRYLKAIHVPGEREPEYLMRLTRDDVMDSRGF